MIEFKRNKETGILEAYENGKKVGDVITMGDKIIILEEKLKTISLYIEKYNMDFSETSQKQLLKLKDYIDKVIPAIKNSDGAGLGLIQAISDYDEICADKKFWDMVVDAEKYYSVECKTFD